MKKNTSLINIASWNMKSFKNNSSFVANQLQNCEIILLQETWLHHFEENLAHNFHPDFNGTSVSSMPSGTLIRGRPYRGTAILWNKEYRQQ